MNHPIRSDTNMFMLSSHSLIPNQSVIYEFNGCERRYAYQISPDGFHSNMMMQFFFRWPRRLLFGNKIKRSTPSTSSQICDGVKARMPRQSIKCGRIIDSHRMECVDD